MSAGSSTDAACPPLSMHQDNAFEGNAAADPFNFGSKQWPLSCKAYEIAMQQREGAVEGHTSVRQAACELNKGSHIIIRDDPNCIGRARSLGLCCRCLSHVLVPIVCQVSLQPLFVVFYEVIFGMFLVTI